MRYAYLLSLINADLERLRMARQLLTTSQTLPRRLGIKAVRSEARSPRQKTEVVSSVFVGAERQHSSRLRYDKATGFAPVDQGMTVSIRASESSNDVSSSVAVSVFSAIEEMISREEVREQTPPPEVQSPPGENAGLPLPQSKLTISGSKPVRRSLALSRTALNHPAPARPVFIPAEQIREEQLRKQGEHGLKRLGANLAAGVPLTAEVLTQRWIQSSAGRMTWSESSGSSHPAWLLRS